MKKIEFEDIQIELLKQLKKGVFLNTKVGDKLNSMTIAWGLSGYIWNKECFSVAVRYSRHTYEMMEKSEYFTISIPASGEMKKELGICGSKSGRDIDKFDETNMTATYLDGFPVPTIEECHIHILCKIAYKQSMEPSLIKANYVEKCYDDKDYHVLYHGEVLSVYMSE